MKWVKSLVLQESEAVESRLLKILEYIYENYTLIVCYISDIDATGRSGNELTQISNDNKIHEIKLLDLINVAKEDGQIFELDLAIKSKINFEIIVRDGYSIDILGDGAELPASVLGEHKDEDLALFGY